MNFVEDQFRQQEFREEQFKENFESGYGPIARHSFFIHLLKYLVDVKNHINQGIDQFSGLKNAHLKSIRPQDSAEHLSKVISQEYIKIVEKKTDGNQLVESDIFWLVLKTFRKELLTATILYILSTLARIAATVMIIFLLESIIDNEITKAYIFSAIFLVCWYIYQTILHNGYVMNSQTGFQLKAAFSMLLYAKASRMTSYVMKTSELGKITNLIANDLEVIELRIAQFMQSINFPAYIIGYTVVLFLLIGWPAFVGITMMLLWIPLSNRISKKNGQILEEVNKYKDERVQITSETIVGIKYVKLYGWQLAFKKTIKQVRQKQLKQLKKLAFGRAIDRSLAYFVGFSSTLIMYVLAAEVRNELTFPIIFSTLEIMAALKIQLTHLAQNIDLFYELKIVFGRFASIFNVKDKKMIKINQDNRLASIPVQPQQFHNDLQQCQTSSRLYRIPHPQNLQESKNQNLLKTKGICFKNFNGYWKEDFTTPSLKNINYIFEPGKIYGITGKIGSGKSGLIGAIIQQLPYYSGQIKIQGKIVYVEQEPIIFSDTVKNNIVFGRHFEQERYRRTIQAACLQSDLRILSYGDQTIVGQKGTTLSGGQKARLALARAIYQEADIYILDDPISAVDSKVAKKLFQGCLRPLGRQKTVILVTHQIGYIKQCDEALIMDNGAIVASGNPLDLQFYLDKLLEQEGENQSQDQINNQEEKPQLEIINEQKSGKSEGITVHPISEPVRHTEDELTDRFDEENTRVTFSTYKNFFLSNSINYCLLPFTFILFLVSEGIITIYYRFLTEYESVKDGTSAIFNNNNFTLFWLILSLLVVLLFIICTIKFYCLNMSLIYGSKAVHQNMIESILRSPCNYFDKNPSGILINKFSTDLGIIDNNIIHGMMDAVEGPFMIAVALVNMCQINLYFLIPTFILTSIAILFFVYARPAIIGCKQLDLQKKGPLIHFYSQTMNGLTQISVYGQRRANIKKFTKVLNESSKATIGFEMVASAFGCYQTFISIVLVVVGVIMGIALLDQQNRELYGVTVVYLVSISAYIHWILRQMILVESLMVSAQRILQIENLSKEKQLRNQYDKQIGLDKEIQLEQAGITRFEAWPQNPSLELINFSAKYDDNLPLILKNLNFKVEAKEKVAIVGRTGAGKSSIIQALFRLFQPESGSQLLLDNYNALDMGLHSLRQHISVIPQVPFLFRGSVRQNIDPFQTATEERLWEALHQSGLSQHIQLLDQGLDTNVDNIAQCFSVGQRQLLCLARALLKNNKYLILDEATSNVDMKTDSFIQQVIREKFKETTVITIAHRLHTITDYDKVIVMSRGRIVEYGAPWELLKSGRFFSEMVRNTGEASNKLIRKRSKLAFMENSLRNIESD